MIWNWLYLPSRILFTRENIKKSPFDLRSENLYLTKNLWELFNIGRDFWHTLCTTASLDRIHEAGSQTGLFSSHTSYNFYVRTACLICLPVCLAVLCPSVRLFIPVPVLPLIVSGSVATCQDRTETLSACFMRASARTDSAKGVDEAHWRYNNAIRFENLIIFVSVTWIMKVRTDLLGIWEPHKFYSEAFGNFKQ